MNNNDVNLNSVNGSKSEKGLTIKFICKSKVWIHFSVKIEPGDIDETYMFEQLIDLLGKSEVLFCPNDPDSWKDACRVVYKDDKAILNKKLGILELFNNDTSPIVFLVGTGVNDSNYFGKTITFKELLELPNKIGNEKQTTKRKLCIERPNKNSGSFDIILNDSNDNKFYFEIPKNGYDSKGKLITDNKILDMVFDLRMLHFGETDSLAYIDSNYIGKTMKYEELLNLYNQKKQYDIGKISHNVNITDVDNWNVDFNSSQLILKISREDFGNSCSTWQSVINTLVNVGILCSADIAHFGKTITNRGADYLAQAIIKMLVDIEILKRETELQPNSKLCVAPAYHKKTISFKEVLQLYDKVISQKQVKKGQKEAKGNLQLKIWCSDKIGDGFTVEINQDDIDSELSSQYLESIVNSVTLIDSNVLKSSLFQMLLDTKILSNVSKNIALVHDKKFATDDWNKKSLEQKLGELKCPVDIYAHGSVLSNNDYVGKTIKFNELIELLNKYKNQNQQNEIIANKPKSKTISFNCAGQKQNTVDNFSLEINCEDVDNNLLFKDFIKELVDKGVFYYSSHEVPDPYKAIYCNGKPVSELTVGEVLELPAVSMSKHKFIVGMARLHINGVYVNRTMKFEDVIKAYGQIESQKQLNKKSLEQSKLESTLPKDNPNGSKKENEADKNVKDKKSLVIPFQCGSKEEQQIFNLELENDDIEHGYKLQGIVKILIEAKILTWSKMNWQLDCPISCRGCSLTDKSVSEALKLVNNNKINIKNETSPFLLLQTQIGSDYNNQTMKLKDVIKLRDEIKNQQQISNEKQNKQDSINVDNSNSNSNVNLLNACSDKKNQTITIQARKEGQNFANFSIEFENGDTDDSYTVGQLIDLLHDAKVVICKREDGWKSANYSEHATCEIQKSISEAFMSYTTPKITLFESVFYDSSYFNKKMTFKSLIKLRDNLKSEELKKQGHLSEKSAQPKIDKTESETLVDKNNLSNLLQNDNKRHDENSQDALITEKQKEQLKDKNEIDQQTNENNPTGSFSKNNKCQEKDSVDKDINDEKKLQEQYEGTEAQNPKQAVNVNNMLFDNANKNVKPNFDVARGVPQPQLQPQLQIPQSQKESENGKKQYIQQTEDEEEHGKLGVFLIFIKNNRRKIAISVFSIGGGIAIGLVIGWIFAPILPTIGLVLIFSDLKFNFLEPTEISQDLNAHVGPEKTDLGKAKFFDKDHIELPAQDGSNLTKTNTLS